MVYILHIDTSGTNGLVLLSCDGIPVAESVNETERDHAGSINRMIGAVLEAAQTDLAALSAVAVCNGPGSYTGLRIGLATAKGLCYALDKPLITHNRLELIADKQPGSDAVLLSVLPARPGEYFAAAYKGAEEIVPPTHVDTAALYELISRYGHCTITGLLEADVVLHAGQQYRPNDRISSSGWGAAAFNSFSRNNFADIASSEPLYLKQVFIHAKK